MTKLQHCMVFLLAFSGCGFVQGAQIEATPVEVDRAIVKGERLDYALACDAAYSYLISAVGYEAELVLLTRTGDSTVSTHIPSFRMGPRFLFIAPEADCDAIRFAVEVVESTRRSHLDISVAAIPRDLANQPLINVYRAASSAMQQRQPDDMPWETKTKNLAIAGRLLAQMGEVEQGLWLQLLAAQLIYWHLGDWDQAARLAKFTYWAAKARGAKDLMLAALQVHGAALIERGGHSRWRSAVRTRIGRQSLAASARLASDSHQYEQAFAYLLTGVSYFIRDQFDDAVNWYRRVEAVSEALGDEKLSAQVQHNIALVFEDQYEYETALRLLWENNRQLRMGMDRAELANNLNELGRIYRSLGDFRQALPLLVEAHEIYSAIADRSGKARINLTLGIAYRQIGSYSQAKERLKLAIEALEETGDGDQLISAYQHSADIARQEGDFGLMAEYRNLEQSIQTSSFDQARYRRNRARDYAAQRQYSKAVEAFGQCADISAKAGRIRLMNQCLIAQYQYELQQNSIAGQSMPEIVEKALVDLQQSVLLPDRLQSLQARARILELQGEKHQALSSYQSLIEEMRRYRQSLPGVLGSWYWESRKAIFQSYFRLFLAQGADAPDRAYASFAELARLRNLHIRQADPASGKTRSDDEEAQLRYLIRERIRTRDPGKRHELSNQIDRKLLELNQAEQAPTSLQASAIRYLAGQLQHDQAVLTYHLDRETLYVWLVSHAGIEFHSVDVGGQFAAEIEAVKERLGSIGSGLMPIRHLDALGEQLLGRIQDQLTERLYFIPSGVFSGLPIDALRLNGKPLALSHSIVNVFTISSVSDARQQTRVDLAGDRVLLAGAPAVATGGLPPLAGAKREIEILTDLLNVPPHNVLSGESFSLQNFLAAGLDTYSVIHLPTHAVNDLEYPEQSRMILSPPVNGEVGDTLVGDGLTPVGVAGLALNRPLVVLSACSSSGVQQFAFDHSVGLVSAFLNAGAGPVVATLWPVGDQETAGFVETFYRGVQNGMSAIEALAAAKRKAINAARNGGIYSWAAFQIYLG